MAWEKLDNVRGPKGEKGDTGTVASTSAATLPAGEAATVVISGAKDPHMHLGIPRGDTGERGPAGSVSSASAESVPAEEQAAVIMSGTDDVKHMHVKIPRGLPGVEAVPSAEAVGTYLEVADSPAQPGFQRGVASILGEETAARAAVDERVRLETDRLPEFEWARITSLNPIMVVLDSDPSAPVPALAASHGFGDGARVMVSMQQGVRTIVGTDGAYLSPAGSAARSELMHVVGSSPARPEGSLWPQALEWDESVRRWYIAMSGTVGGASINRIERRAEDLTLIDHRDFPADTSTEGLPFWRNLDGELCFMVRTNANGNGYKIFNYDTGVLGPQVSISGPYKAAVRDGVLWTCNASSATSGVKRFYAYDFASVQAGAPALLRQVDLEYRCMYEKVQSFTVGSGGDFVLSMGKSAGTPGLFVYDSRGAKIYAVEYDQASFADMISAARPGLIGNRHSYRHESEGVTYRDGRLVTGHVVYNGDASQAQFVLVEHGVGTPVSASPIARPDATGTMDLPITGTAFELWGSSPMSIMRAHDYVEIRGEVKPVDADWPGKILLKLPDGLRPFTSMGSVGAQLASTGSNTCSATITTAGDISLGRFGPEAPAAGQWIRVVIGFYAW